MIADDDVADTHGDADPPGALDLGAADLHGVAVTDIVLDGGGEPRRRDVEIDGTRAEPPPQRAETADEDDGRAPTTTASRFSQRSPASQRRMARNPSPKRWKPELERDNSRRARWPAASS